MYNIWNCNHMFKMNSVGLFHVHDCYCMNKGREFSIYSQVHKYLGKVDKVIAKLCIEVYRS